MSVSIFDQRKKKEEKNILKFETLIHVRRVKLGNLQVCLELK